MDFSGTEPSLLVPEECSWGITCGHRVDKGGVIWGDVACGTLRSPDVGEPPPPKKARTARSGPSSFSHFLGPPPLARPERVRSNRPKRSLWHDEIGAAGRRMRCGGDGVPGRRTRPRRPKAAGGRGLLAVLS